MVRSAHWLAALLLLVWSGAALAHGLPGTSAALDFHQQDVGLELAMPLDQFELGFKRPVMDAPLRVVERYKVELRSYLVEHIRPVAPDGRPWQVRVDDLRVEEDSGPGHVDLVARLTLTPPSGAPVRRFHLNYSVINHEVMTHTVLVFARSDWENGVMAAEPELLGTIRWLTTEIDVDRQQGSFWIGFRGVVRLGMEHIAGGADHLLFLLTLLLPAPLSRRGIYWGSYVGSRTTIIRLATLVTAFTIGHSLTLMLGALGSLAVPSQPLESRSRCRSSCRHCTPGGRSCTGARRGWQPPSVCCTGHVGGRALPDRGARRACRGLRGLRGLRPMAARLQKTAATGIVLGTRARRHAPGSSRGRPTGAGRLLLERPLGETGVTFHHKDCRSAVPSDSR